MSFIGLDLIDRDQWHSQITDFFEQAVQRGLVNHRAS